MTYFDLFVYLLSYFAPIAFFITVIWTLLAWGFYPKTIKIPAVLSILFLVLIVFSYSFLYFKYGKLT